ncbi:MAG TPA: hypothetical protein PKL65_11150 [Bacteroidales bacterium]|jgi:hypothetical protein|nr:hypothetical protein [Bacteroidales bacterium]HNR42779.1 hypothetical protein [Bacteroidales bacterium]HPM18400.1 hypothetical protein [Bacteroidales bacterium]HQG77343.1 hypothetical protein [Bacteroidales bacterium]
MYRYNNISAALILVILFLFSCRNDSPQDLSLRPEEYQKLGLPDHIRLWNLQDYINANITLSTLKTNFPNSLPRKSSKKSGAVFARLVSGDNLSFMYDKSMPLHGRAQIIQHFTRFYSELESIYSVETDVRNYYSDELADINLFGLLVHDRMLELAWQIMDSDDEEDRDLQYGLKTVKRNYLNLVDHLLDEQVKSEVYSDADLDRLSDRLEQSLAVNVSWFLPSERDSVAESIEKAMPECPTAHIRGNFNKMLKYLKNS